ncbi:MAG: pyrroloquinoline quinone biosynthesis peptide chaperone PqqD [Alphaproteobacteria bacterium]
MSLPETAIPALSPHIQVRFDEARGQWIMNAPERVLLLDDQGVAILNKVTGEDALATIIDDLAAAYDAPRDAIAADVIEFLGDLVEKGFVSV